MKELVVLVDKWARQRSIYEKGTPEGQLKKMAEEVIELALEMGDDCDDDWIKTELGDVFVTAIVLAKLKRWEPAECLELAYNKISKREGEMKNGVFVKNV